MTSTGSPARAVEPSDAAARRGATESHVHDAVAIGLGPFNLGLLALAEPVEGLDVVALERRDGFDWHPGMLLPDATVQTPFLADLVTLADPTSRFSFLEYAKRAGHLYSFYIRETFQPLRSEFNAYCQWAAGELSHRIRFGADVDRVAYDGEVFTVGFGDEAVRGRHLVLGTGTPPFVPPCCDPPPTGVLHNSAYLDHRAALLERPAVTVVGGGQSAAEVFHDLLSADGERELAWITRSERFFPLEYTKLTLEMTSPEYTSYFHDLPAGTRDALVGAQAPLYKGIDSELIDAIFHLLYRKGRTGPPPATLLTNTELAAVTPDEDELVLGLRHTEQDETFELRTGAVVLGTGYRYREPAFLAGLGDRLRRDEQGRFDVRRDYTIDRDGRVFVQNAELHTHGFVAPDLGMAAYRNSHIVRALSGREVYPIEDSIAFQDFGVPEHA